MDDDFEKEEEEEAQAGRYLRSGDPLPACPKVQLA